MKGLECLTISLPEDILKAECIGDYSLARRLISLRLERAAAAPLRERLNFELQKLDRLESEYPYNFEKAWEMTAGNIADFSKEEFYRLKDEGYIDWIFINGEPRFQRRFYDNILKTYPNITDRLSKTAAGILSEKNSRLVSDNIDEIMSKGKKSYYIRIKTGIKVRNNSRLGETVKVHIPLPRISDQTDNLKILGTSMEPKSIAPEDHPQRTVYFEKAADREDIFTVEYSFENHVEYKAADAAGVSAEQPDFYTGEQLPQIAFTPYLKELCKEIVGAEKNPLNKARRIYDYITQNVRYSFVRDYFTIENIPEYTALNLKGDCGAQALLFITLCRIAKIPAKWQSGLYANVYHKSPHDWAQFYVAPFGWLFTDPSLGGGAFRSGNMKKWDFYFGNLDNFRMIANSEFQAAFTPATRYLRLDPYDNQSGEIEYENGPADAADIDTILEVIESREIS